METKLLFTQKGANDEDNRDLCILKIQLSAENSHDTLEDRKLIELLNCKAGCNLLMGRAYKDDTTRAIVLKQGLMSSLRIKTEKYLGNMILNFTNVAMKLSTFPSALNVFIKFLPNMINLMLSIFLL